MKKGFGNLSKEVPEAWIKGAFHGNSCHSKHPEIEACNRHSPSPPGYSANCPLPAAGSCSFPGSCNLPHFPFDVFQHVQLEWFGTRCKIHRVAELPANPHRQSVN